MQIEILSALSIEDEFIRGLWLYVSNMGQSCGLKEICRLFDTCKDFDHAIFDVIYILSSLILYLVTIYDEYEFYEKQAIFKLEDYKLYGQFLNGLVFRIITAEQSIDLNKNMHFAMFHQLLVLLHDKDSMRTFTFNADFWIVRDIKTKAFLADIDKQKPYALAILHKIPHVIPVKQRIDILQRFIAKDKEAVFGPYNNGAECPIVRIKIRRDHVVNDGYAQLRKLTPVQFKNVIRVVFVNEFGLNEAGIDQDGVFKEFLQETIKQILNPEFSMFKVTAEQQLYPSELSYYVDNHLELFEFIGKIFGKAVYEGNVADVQFASFFLRHLVGYRSQYYSFFDDLASLDRELYKQLSAIKRDYDGQTLTALDLTFTYDESHMGKLVSWDLCPSGGFIKVTETNKVQYIHLLAMFKLYKQIKRQVNAFNDGFKSIVKQEWLNMFSIPEIQYLISGTCHDIDLDDLKANVQYWGGLHAAHRLVKWLWDVVQNDFSRDERSLFLKFVTSCSKPPLLGFASLNPKFTIRCVEAEEADGTVYEPSVSGFFKTILNLNNRDTARLPTSSTCFNLLKLPNYSKKSTLKDKLRFAIHSNAGFELS
jgi:ubiquitin-protein ligase E3 B